MTPRLDRREFLRSLGWFTAAACAPSTLAACTGEGLSTSDDDRARVFPQGLASGDPTPSSVIVWVRAVSEDGGPHSVHYEVALDDAFTQKVAEGELVVGPESDFTAKLKVTGLASYTTYHYRFVAAGVQSIAGRTKTAPGDDDNVSPRFAFAACQDFNGRYFHAYEALLAEDPLPDFVVHLGDYVYETENDPRFQDATEARRIALADGLDIGSDGVAIRAAKTLEDYRSLYRQFRTDPVLQQVHASIPFLTIWDDHEFADDCWGSHSTHWNEAKGDESDPPRRHAANRAWFEYQPADVTFDEAASPPDDLTIYRQFRWGKHVELFLTDQRSYRSDHVVPEGPVDTEVAKILPNTSLGSRVFVLKKGFDPKEAAAAPTMLGAKQTSWLTEGLSSSKATWKFWGSETQVAQMTVNLKDYDVPETFKDLFYFSTDQWDGYRSERRAILEALGDTENVVVLTGDIHAFLAAELHADFDAPKEPMAVEYVVGGLSSTSIQEITQRVIDATPTFSSLGLGALVPKMDALLAEAGPHYRLARTKANGIGLVDVDGTKELRVTFLLVGGVTSPTFDGKVERITLRTPASSSRIERL
jgi:alkaline phosphatase D